ncbi:MAG: hypothetical protein JSV91_05445 [Phycisphaerales bacterium]|nr:MAG: hypothetical protein JSV91_05445 [Phycisphaerales bacterium]
MLALNETFQTIKERLSALSLTARLLIGALMTILVMMLVIVGLVAGRSAMSPLPVSTLSTEARTQLVSYMNGRGIAWEERGGDLFVAADQKYNVLGELADSQLIDGGQLDFTKLVENDDPFTDKASKRRNFLIAKNNELARIISRMRDISRASVIISEPERLHGPGSLHVESTASVQIDTTSGEPSQNSIDAVANLVAGAHAGLKLENVKVVANGRLCEVRTEDRLTGRRYLEQKIETERLAKKAIRGAVGYIPGVLIEVNAQVDTRRIHETGFDVDDPKIGPLESSSRTVERTNQVTAGEAGVRANLPADVPGAGGRDSRDSEERTAEKTVPVFPGGTKEIINPTGYALQINASVGVPESYLAGLYGNRHPDDTAEPDQTALDELMVEEEARIRSAVNELIDTGAIPDAVEGTVSVYAFPDFAVPALGGFGGGVVGGSEADGTGFGGQLVFGDLIKGVGLGFLVLVSLAMMFMMVRKASVRPELPTAEELVGVPPALAETDSDVVGEASEADAVLEGVEIDEDALRRGQMLDQINDTAINQPDQMAALLKRWIRVEE